MKITVKYFASIREALGQGSEVVQSSATTVGALRDELMARSSVYADCLARQRSVRAAIDQLMCDESAVLTEACEVAFFPPVTGG